MQTTRGWVAVGKTGGRPPGRAPGGRGANTDTNRMITNRVIGTNNLWGPTLASVAVAVAVAMYLQRDGDGGSRARAVRAVHP